MLLRVHIHTGGAEGEEAVCIFAKVRNNLFRMECTVLGLVDGFVGHDIISI